jgi:hypothetical protein
MAQQRAPTISPEDLQAALDPNNWSEIEATGKLRNIGAGEILLLRVGEAKDIVIAGMPVSGGDGSRPYVTVPGVLVDSLRRVLGELHDAT